VKKYFKVKFKPEIYREIERQIGETGLSAIIRDIDIGQTYNSRFLQTPYFFVSEDENVSYAYRIKEPSVLRGYFINKNHVVPFGMLQLDDELFEWSE
jgi:hypothetical protein